MVRNGTETRLKGIGQKGEGRSDLGEMGRSRSLPTKGRVELKSCHSSAALTYFKCTQETKVHISSPSRAGPCREKAVVLSAIPCAQLAEVYEAELKAPVLLMDKCWCHTLIFCDFFCFVFD